jgi:hypothetical protein
MVTNTLAGLTTLMLVRRPWLRFSRNRDLTAHPRGARARPLEWTECEMLMAGEPAANGQIWQYVY